MMDLASIATGVGIASALGAAGAGIAALFRRGGQVEARVESAADATQRTATQHDRDTQRVEQALSDHEKRDDERHETIRREQREDTRTLAEKLDAIRDEVLEYNRLTRHEAKSTANAIALDVNRLAGRVDELARRSSGGTLAVKPGG